MARAYENSTCLLLLDTGYALGSSRSMPGTVRSFLGTCLRPLRSPAVEVLLFEHLWMGQQKPREKRELAQGHTPVGGRIRIPTRDIPSLVCVLNLPVCLRN